MDFCKAPKDKAVEILPLDGLGNLYPMLCFCNPDGDQKLCRFTPKGHQGHIPFRRKLLWAWPMFSWYALKYLKVGYMKKFFTDDYPQASLGAIAFSSVLSVMVDAFTDPNMATWTDSLRSKYGRRRPFILASAFVVPVVFVLHWLPLLAGSSPLAASFWFGAFHIGYKLCDTLFNIPFDGWGAQLTPWYTEKSSVWMLRDLMANFGILCGMAVAPLVFVTEQCSSTPDDGCLELPLLSAAFGLVYMHACLQLVYYGKESVPEIPESGAARRRRCSEWSFSEQDTVPMLISTCINWPFRILLLTDVAKALGQEIPFTVMPYMTAWVIGEKCHGASDFFGYMAVANIACGMISLYPWIWLSARLGKYKAYLAFNTLLAVTTLSFVTISLDTGDCFMSNMSMLLNCIFGATYGGSFLLKDMITDVVDYDEFLSGGRRREASYMMAVEFIPKFMSIPGECVPFMLMAHYGYARPLRHREACSAEALARAGSSLKPDGFCDAFYRSEHAGSQLCSNTLTCSQYLAQGVSFVCNDAHQECGIRQNGSVQWVLSLSFSLIPCICVALGLVALITYPKAARTEMAHERLLDAITRLRQGETVEDPWRPGNWVSPAPHLANSGALSYFWPSELGTLLKMPRQEDGRVDVSPLFWWTLLSPALACVVVIPVGTWIMVAGLDGLSDSLGASSSSIGLMVVGAGVTLAWFGGERAFAARHLQRDGVLRADVVARYNALCPFIGQPRHDQEFTSDKPRKEPPTRSGNVAAGEQPAEVEAKEDEDEEPEQNDHSSSDGNCWSL